VGLSLPRARSEVVGGRRLHLSEHALLPVGRNGPSLVRGPRNDAPSSRDDGSAVDPLDDVVLDPTDGGVSPAQGGRNAVDLRVDRARG